MRVCSIVLIALPLLATAAWAADPVDPARAEARAHFRNGARLIRAGAYDAAVAEFSEAYRLYPNERIHYDLAQAYRLKHDSGQAVAHYRRYLAVVHEGELAADARQQLSVLGATEEPPPTPQPQAGSAASLLASASPERAASLGAAGSGELGSLRPTLPRTDAPAAGETSGSAAQTASPGTVAPQRTTAEAGAPRPGTLTPEAGLGAPPKLRPRPAYKKWWPWTIGGVVVIGGAIGLGFALTAHSPAATIGKVTF